MHVARICMPRARVIRVIAIGSMALATTASATASPFVINEVVTDPQSDWGQSVGGSGNPFDGVPGDGTVTSSDEYIELLNISETAQSLQGYILEMTDTTPEIECFTFDTTDIACTQSDVYRVFQNDGTEIILGSLADRLQAVPPGGYVVLGNPTGALNNTITLTLLNDGLVLDTVALGESGSPDADAIARADEAVSRFPNGADSGNDQQDFLSRSATLGRSNGDACLVTQGQMVINEVVGDPQSNWNHSVDPKEPTLSGFPFDGTSDGTDITAGDEYIELKNLSGQPLDLRGCTLTMTDSTPERFFFQAAPFPANPYIHVFSNSGERVGGTISLRSVPSDGYVVLGDPPGSINNGTTSTPTIITLAGPAPIDSVSFGNPAPTLNASTPFDEAIVRLPDGIDTDDDAADFAARQATLGRSNDASTCVLLAGQAVVNEVVGDPETDWNQTEGGSGTPFDGTRGNGAVTASDEYIELKNVTNEPLDFWWCIIEIIDTTPEVVTINGANGMGVFSADGTFLGGADFIHAVPSGGYLVVGNPPGQINNGTASAPTVTLLLGKDGVELDRVSFGDAAPSLGADSHLNEAVARMPDGTDTNVDAADFQPCAATPGTSNGDNCQGVCNGIHNLDAWKAFVGSQSGPAFLADCPSMDTDADGDLDMNDAAAFQRLYVDP